MGSRLVVGAKRTSWPGWISTDRNSLDIRRAEDWQRAYPAASVERILCEHVLEHMTTHDALKALRNFKEYLEPGGFARIAVPDGFNPSAGYQDHSRPGGRGRAVIEALVNPLFNPHDPPHVEHYNYISLSSLIQLAGLTPRLLEYHDISGRFHQVAWDKADGEVRRSHGHEYVTQQRFWLGFDNTSLIVDAVKE